MWYEDQQHCWHIDRIVINYKVQILMEIIAHYRSWIAYANNKSSNFQGTGYILNLILKPKIWFKLIYKSNNETTWARDLCASASRAATVATPFNTVATFSHIGVRALQCPHHGAKNSTRTTLFESRTCHHSKQLKFKPKTSHPPLWSKSSTQNHHKQTPQPIEKISKHSLHKESNLVSIKINGI